MRNLKRVLSLALALVMVLGMMVITTSAADFTDADEITYTEAVDVMAGLGMFKGDNGALKPQEVLTRQEAATLMARLMLGEKTADKLVATKQIFADVEVDDWAAPYIEYCYNTGLIGGYVQGDELVFNPDGNLTGVAFAKLILCAMGFDANAQGYGGSNWASAIAVDALTKGLTIDGVVISADLTREQAAQMLFQVLEKDLVEYWTSYDYATGAPVLVGPIDAGETFMGEYFPKLVKIEGTIVDTVTAKGKTTIDTDPSKTKTDVDLTNTAADWTTVGYAARAWAINGEALSLVITGEDASVTTNGTTVTALTNDDDDYEDTYVADLDDHAYYVLNGSKTTKNAVAAAADEIGAKVALVNNDRDDDVEAVVVTTYTASQVTKVTRKSVTGVVSDYSYSLCDGDPILAKNLANVDELAKGDYIAYTVVDEDEYYVTVLESAEGEFESITRTKLDNGADKNVKTYNIDGEGYVKSDLSAVAHTEFLKSSNINEDVIYVTDMYGYLVFAVAPQAAADDYLFVLANEDSHGIKDIAETEIAFADGSTDIVDVDCKDEVEDDELAGEIYSYTEKNGAYTLKDQNAYVLEDASYTTKKLKMERKKVTSDTILVDLREYVAGDADEGTVYVGYREIPSFVGGTVYYLGDDTIELAFLVEGEDPAAAGKEVSFVVFDTDVNDVDEIDDGVFVYELEEGVLVNGELVENYVLTQAQKDAIDALGVGAYFFDKTGALAEYYTFESDSVYWTPESSGALYDKEMEEEITDDWTPVFLNIEDGIVNDWDEIVDEGLYFCWFDEDNDVVYIVADEEGYDEDGNINRDLSVFYAKDAAVVTVYEGVAYYSKEGKVTNLIEQKFATVMDKAEENDLTAYVYADGKFHEVDGASTTEAANSTQLDAALTDYDVDTIVLGAGNFTATFANLTAREDLTIIGSEDTVLTFGQNVPHLNAKNLTIDGCTILPGTVKWYYHLNVGYIGSQEGFTYTFSNCKFVGEGKQGIYINAKDGFKYVITDCAFEGDFGAECPITIQDNAGEYEVVVTGCTFENIPDDAYIGIHYGNPDMTLTTDVDSDNIVDLPR